MSIQSQRTPPDTSAFPSDVCDKLYPTPPRPALKTGQMPYFVPQTALCSPPQMCMPLRNLSLLPPLSHQELSAAVPSTACLQLPTPSQISALSTFHPPEALSHPGSLGHKSGENVFRYVMAPL